MAFVSAVHSTKLTLQNQITRRSSSDYPSIWRNNSLKYSYEPLGVGNKAVMKKERKSCVSAIRSTKTTPEIARRTGNFHPSIWGDYFLEYADESQGVGNKAEQNALERKKEEVRSMLRDTKSSNQRIIQLIDTIQRLGIAIHFESEIGEILGQVNKLLLEDESLHDDLYTVSLIFRLLRQEGVNTSSDVFKKFLDEEGKFKDELQEDVRGMLSLYEAAHFLKHGESVLDEALSFTRSHLQSSITSPNLSPFLAMQVKHALNYPIRKGMPRIEAKHFISIYHEDPLHDEFLLSFAKLDFNNLQKLHRKEIGAVTKWYKDMEFQRKAPFARDRLVENYMYTLGIHSEAKFSRCRMILTKFLCTASVLDDIYDTYGTIEEIQALTDAIHKWDIKCINQLPDYIKPIYQALLDVFEDIEKVAVTEGRGSYRIHVTKEIAQRFFQSYYDEAKCFHMNHVPTVEDYIEVGSVSTAVNVIVACSFLGMGDIATDEAFKWLGERPEIVRCVGIICRLLDDIAGHKLERDRGHSATSIECYMKQHAATEEEAYTYFRFRIAETWKNMNEEWLESIDIEAKPLLIQAVNIACTVEFLYKDESSYTKPAGLMKDTIKSLLLDPFPM